MQKNWNHGSRQATIFVIKGEASFSPKQDTSTDVANVCNITFHDYFSKMWVCVSDKVWESMCGACMCVHTEHLCAYRGRRVSSNMEDSGLQSGMASTRLTYGSSLFPYPCQYHLATLLRGGMWWNVIITPTLKGCRNKVCLGHWGPHLSERETRIQTEWTQKEPMLSQPLA